MTLPSGHRLGPYEVLSPLGEGGMGEVYRARDSRLERDVAVKVLSRDISANAQFKARFQREAKTISQLSHPNICTLFDVGEADGIDFIVMELLEGETLADRLSKGPLPLVEALKIGAQIADALDRAHRQEIVHRDLKPGNVILAKSGAKLLDFGLAKPAGGPAASPDDATQQKPLTQEGTIVGTFQYMAPEQLEGAEADGRTDIFALGSVLYEMVTGRRAFEGKTRMSLIASIMSGVPEPISMVQPISPIALDHVVSRCLAKDPDDRWQSAHDVAEELRWISEAGSQAGVAIPRARRRARWLVPAVAATLGIVAGVAAHWQYSIRSRPAPQPLKYVIEYGDFVGSRPMLSPDGRRIAYTSDRQIVVRELSGLEPRAVPGTEGGHVPFWSPDGSWLGFSTSDAVWKVRPDGSGRAQLCAISLGSTSGGAVWLEDGRILFDTGRSGIYEVSEKGGEPRLVLELDEGEADFHDLDELPGGKGFLFVVHKGDEFNRLDVWDGASRRTVLQIADEGLGSPTYSPTGHILFKRFARGRGLWAVPFSLDRLETTGEPFPVSPGGSEASASGTTLAFVLEGPQATMSQIVEYDRSGNVLRTIGSPKMGLAPDLALSPDGRRLVVQVVAANGSDLWQYSLDGGEPAQLTFDSEFVKDSPVWLHDGSEVVFTVAKGMSTYNLRSIDLSGGTRSLGVGAGPVAQFGSTLVYVFHSEGYNFDLWSKELDDPGMGKAILDDEGWELGPAISPDARLIAYQKGGTTFVRTFPAMSGPWPVKEGCTAPKWSRDGGSIYCAERSAIVQVPVSVSAGAVRVGTPDRLFEVDHAKAATTVGARFDLGPNGDTFLLVRPLEPPPGIVVVHNWLQTIE